MEVNGRIPPRLRWIRETRREQLPVLVWLVAASLSAYLLASRVRSHEFVGLAQALQYEVSASIDGTVDAIPVKLFDAVAVGDVVARLDDRLVEAQLRTATAEASRISAELGAERSRLTAGAGPLAEGYSSDLRRFKIDEEQFALETLSLRVAVESDEVEVERLKVEAARAQALFESGVLGEADRDAAQLAHRRVVVQLARNRDLLERMEGQEQAARHRREDFERSHPSPAGVSPVLQPLVEAVKVQSARLEELRVQMRSLTLRSPIAGEVSQVLCRPGQSVTPGEAVVLISEKIPTEILAYLPEAAAGRVREKTQVLIARRSDPSRQAESYVTRVGATIQATPSQLWRDPQRPEYGLPVSIAVTSALSLTPGEVVFVRTIR